MAVADVAVAMRARDKRRLTMGAAIGVAAIVAVGLVNRSPGPVPSTRSTQIGSTGHLSFGLTAQQVLRVTGRPAAIQGRCWLFHPKAATVGSVPLAPPGTTLPPGSVGNFKLCFSSGVDSDAFVQRYDKQQGGWRWFPWPWVIG